MSGRGELVYEHLGGTSMPRWVRHAGGLALSVALLVGCGSTSGPRGAEKAVYEHPDTPFQDYGPGSCGAPLPTTPLSSIGASVTLTTIPHDENLAGSSRWDAAAEFHGLRGPDLNAVRINREGFRAVVVDRQAEEVLTVAALSDGMFLTNGLGKLGADGIYRIPAVVDAWECPPPGDSRLHAIGDVRGLKEIPAGEHTVMLIVEIGNTAYRSDPIKLVLGKP